MDEKTIKSLYLQPQLTQILVDGKTVAEGSYQAVIVVNGYLGPDLPFSDKPLGSGEFYVYGIRDHGFFKLLSQAKQALRGTISEHQAELGFESYVAKRRVVLRSKSNLLFPVNIDGTMEMTNNAVTFGMDGSVPLLISGEEIG